MRLTVGHLNKNGLTSLDSSCFFWKNTTCSQDENYLACRWLHPVSEKKLPEGLADKYRREPFILICTLRKIYPQVAAGV